MHVLIGGVDYSNFYQPASLKATSRTGSDRSSFAFTIENPSAVPLEESEVEVWDSSQLRIRLGRGRIKRTKRRVLGPSSTHVVLVPRFSFEVDVTGFIRDIDRRPSVSKVYVDKTTGFIFRDLGSLVPGLDISLVGTGGTVLDYFETRHESIANAFNRLATIENRQWWIDLDKRFHFEDIADTPATFSIDDDTWAEIAGLSLTVEPDTDNLANSLRMFYKGKYTDGKVLVYNTSNEISGVGTAWLDQITPGAKFRLSEISNISYTVQEVRSDTLIVLSSAYNEADSIVAVDYVLEDIPRATSAEDISSIDLMSSITGDDGRFAAIIDAPGGYLTYVEARDYLMGVLLQRSNPNVNINFKSTNRQVPGQVEAGQAVPFQLTDWGIDTVLQINQLTIKDLGGEDLDGYPLLEYDFKFQVRLYDLAARLRKKDSEQTYSGKADVAFIEEVFMASERLAITDSTTIPALRTKTSTETLTATDTSEITYEVDGPFFWAPANPGDEPAVWNRSWWT